MTFNLKEGLQTTLPILNIMLPILFCSSLQFFPPYIIYGLYYFKGIIKNDHVIYRKTLEEPTPDNLLTCLVNLPLLINLSSLLARVIEKGFFSFSFT